LVQKRINKDYGNIKKEKTDNWGDKKWQDL
jgi:hypothetical protein